MDSAFRQALGEANKEIRRLDEALTQKTMLYEKLHDAADDIRRHLSNGAVITEVQTVEVNGQRFEVDIWRDWETQFLHHVGEPRPIESLTNNTGE